MRQNTTPGRSSGLVVVVDDDPDMSDLVSSWVAEEGFAVEVFANAASLRSALEGAAPDVVLLDVELPDAHGLELLEEIRTAYPAMHVVMMTANRDVDTVVGAMRLGAVDYVAKPFDRTRVVTATRNAVERSRLSGRVKQLESLVETGSYRGIAGRSPAIRRVFAELDHVVASDVNVLILGESGTGKELVARALQEGGTRAKAPFVAINCAAIPEALVESELFGHERGAFTNATARHVGSVERAHGGTLFLDETGELPLAVQAKLLRVLQERSFRRVGGTSDVRSDFRLVCATHRDLRESVRAGRFREDLYYRLAVFELDLPPLREREGDVGLLAERFLAELAPKRRVHLSSEAFRVMEKHDWPGNVRELRNAMERALVLCGDGPVELLHLPPSLRRPVSHAPELAVRVEAPRTEARFDPRESTRGVEEKSGSTQLAASMDEIEREALRQALERHGGNVTAAVRELGIGRTTVYRKMKKYGLA